MRITCTSTTTGFLGLLFVWMLLGVWNGGYSSPLPSGNGNGGGGRANSKEDDAILLDNILKSVAHLDNRQKLQWIPELVDKELLSKHGISSNSHSSHNDVFHNLFKQQQPGSSFFTHDPDAKRNMTELISSQGYPVERYVVRTKDGFLLNLHRIPHGRSTPPTRPAPGEEASKSQSTKTINSTKSTHSSSPSHRPVVYLQHGLLSSACDWVLNFPDDSLGFILADHGYDVWMGDSRGNTYSKRHVSLKPEDERFWNWSFDEMAKHDTPAFVDFVLNKTGQSSLHYVGHSQGTVMAFALFASQPEFQKKIRTFVALAPVFRMKHIRSPLKYMLFGAEKMYEMFGRKEFLPNDRVIKHLADTLCDKSQTKWLCYNLYFLVCGYDLKNFNQSRLPVYVNHSPAGTSVQAVVHFAQIYQQDQFAMYDFGSDHENVRHYNKTSPPEYDISKVTVPTILFTGPNDWLADPKDVAVLKSRLPNIQASYEIPNWNHLDFVWATNAGTECYPKILEWLAKF